MQAQLCKANMNNLNAEFFLRNSFVSPEADSLVNFSINFCMTFSISFSAHFNSSLFRKPFLSAINSTRMHHECDDSIELSRTNWKLITRGHKWKGKKVENKRKQLSSSESLVKMFSQNESKWNNNCCLFYIFWIAYFESFEVRLKTLGAGIERIDE